SRFAHQAQRKLIMQQRVHRDHGSSAVFSPDGKLAATAAENIVLWDATNYTKITRLEHSARVWSMAFSPDGRWLVSTHWDGAILLWNVAERECVANFNEHSGPARGVAFSPDGKRIASASHDGSVMIWNAARSQKEAVLTGHNARVNAVTFSPDGEWIASCDHDGNTIIWEATQHRPLLTFKGNIFIYCLAMSPDKRWVANTNGVYESTSSRLIILFREGKFYLEHGYSSYGMNFSPDGKWLVAVSELGHIHLWDVTSWTMRDSLESTNLSLMAVSFSPDGKWIVTGDVQGGVHLWSVRPLRHKAVLGRHAARVNSVAFSPDGRRVASASDDQTIALWEVKRRRLITHIGTHTAPVLSVAFSPDGRQLVSGGHDKSVRLYTRHRTLWGWRLD
ncbi:MAG: WD40 repeat domain-containing protein, partial [bacterium]